MDHRSIGKRHTKYRWPPVWSQSMVRAAVVLSPSQTYQSLSRNFCGVCLPSTLSFGFLPYQHWSSRRTLYSVLVSSEEETSVTGHIPSATCSMHQTLARGHPFSHLSIYFTVSQPFPLLCAATRANLHASSSSGLLLVRLIVLCKSCPRYSSLQLKPFHGIHLVF